jgi:hypothetical protein
LFLFFLVARVPGKGAVTALTRARSQRITGNSAGAP